MASGLPDYKSVVRPTFGGAVGSTASKSAVANALTTLVSVTGKGMVYGSFVNLFPAATQANSEVVLEIDETTIIGMSFNKLNSYGLTVARCFPIVLMLFDNTEFDYVAGIAYGLTFETGIKLQYQENHGRTVSVGYTFIYALM